MSERPNLGGTFLSTYRNHSVTPYESQTAFATTDVRELPRTMWIRPYLSRPREVVRLRVGNDGSIYLHAAAPSDEYYWGRSDFEAGEPNLTFDYTQQLAADREPHLSLHPSGDCHIRLRRKDGQPGFTDTIRSIPFADATGEHVATVSAERIGDFPAGGPSRETHMDDKLDAIWEPPAGYQSFRLVFLLNRTEPAFALPCREAWKVTDVQGEFVVYLGIAVFAPATPGVAGHPMTHSIGGFTHHDDHLVWLITK